MFEAVELYIVRHVELFYIEIDYGVVSVARYYVTHSCLRLSIDAPV